MNAFVIDASVVVTILVPEAHREAVAYATSPETGLYAPDFIRVEVANALWNLRRRSIITSERVEEALATFVELPIALYPSTELVEPALALAIEYDRSVYDSLYVALALLQRCPFVTADKRLYNALVPHLPETMVWVEDLPSPEPA